MIHWIKKTYNNIYLWLIEIYSLYEDMKQGRYKLVTCLNCQKTYFTDTTQHAINADTITMCSQDCYNKYVDESTIPVDLSQQELKSTENK